MVALFIQHGNAGEPMSTERVQHQITAIPKTQSRRHGSTNAPTAFLVRYRSMWRRVWERKDGTMYIISAYTHLRISVTED